MKKSRAVATMWSGAWLTHRQSCTRTLSSASVRRKRTQSRARASLVGRVNPIEGRNDYSYYRHHHRDGSDYIGLIGSTSSLPSRVFSGARNVELLRFGGFPTPFRFLILLGKPFNRKSLVWGGESSGMDEYADGIFPHLFKACQLLVIIAHEVIRLLPFAPAHESPVSKGSHPLRMMLSGTESRPPPFRSTLSR